MLVNKRFTYLTCAYLKEQKVFQCKILLTYCYFHMNTKILTGFQICIKVPLKKCTVYRRYRKMPVA